MPFWVILAVYGELAAEESHQRDEEDPPDELPGVGDLETPMGASKFHHALAQTHSGPEKVSRGKKITVYL